jgi:RNA polymerase sigma-B factor
MAIRHVADARRRPDVADDLAELDELVRAYCADHRPDLLDRIVESFDSVVHLVAHRVKWHDEPLDDLMQVARIGLLAAIERFDPARGVAFRTFAEATIVGVLHHHHRSALQLRVPRGVQDLNTACHGAVERLAASLKRMPTSAEVADDIGVDVFDVLQAMAVDQLFHPVSLPSSSSDERDPDLRERLGRLDALLESADDRAEMQTALAALPSRQRTILFLRFYEGWTQTEIGTHLGISQVQVSRLTSQALTLLRSQVQPSDTHLASA